MGHLTYGYNYNEAGRVVHRRMTIDELRSQKRQSEGWVDAPDKLPGYEDYLAQETHRLAETAKVISRESRPTTDDYHGSPAAIDRAEQRRTMREATNRKRDARGRFR